MRKAYILFLIPFLGIAQIPEGYYNGTENLSGYALKTKLHQIISQKNINWHYSDLPTYYATTDVDRYYENDGTLLDIYSEFPNGPDAYEYNFSQMVGSASAEGQGFNREHMMPQSTFYSNYPMYSDLFYVVPTDARINQLRSNYPYGIGGSQNFYTFSNTSKINNSAIPNSPYTGRVYEPIDEFKGDIARSLLYFVVRYQGKLGTFKYNTTTNPVTDQNAMDGTEERGFEDWYIHMLINWSNLDPVSQREIDRNNYVYNIQKNRNPFIDHPEWINVIWNQTPDTIAPQPPTQLLATQTAAYFVNLKWQSSSSSDVIGYEIYQNGNLIAKTDKTEIVIDHLTPNSGYIFSVKGYDNGYLKSPESNQINITTLVNDNYSKDLFFSKYIKGSSNNKALEITNLTGHPVNLQGYKLSIQYRSGNNYYFENPFELEGTINHGERFVVINPHANLSCYNTSDAKFITASPALTFTGSNYVELNYSGNTVDALGAKNASNNLNDKSLYRLQNVNQPTATFNLDEWTVYGNDYCEGLGSPLATSDIIKDNSFGIYPNPVKTTLNIKGISKIDSAEIFDMNGRKVLTSKNANINVENLPNGVYLLKVNHQVIKFIKVN